MALIQVYYRDLLKDEVELQPGVTTIGRSTDSDIKIDNAGVSAHHAKIIHDGNDFIIDGDSVRMVPEKTNNSAKTNRLNRSPVRNAPVTPAIRTWKRA